MKNFSNTKVVLVTTIPAPDAQAGMIDYTFLLPSKNDLYKPHFPPSQASTGKTCGLPLATGNIPEREAHPEVAID
jgi:hypothetical protein